MSYQVRTYSLGYEIVKGSRVVAVVSEKEDAENICGLLNEQIPGPNHEDGCTGARFTYSGGGYTRVRVCECGAEDHDPEAGSFGVSGNWKRERFPR